MLKLFLILMLAIGTMSLAIGTISVANDITESEEYQNLTLDQYQAAGTLAVGGVAVAGGMAAGLLLDIPGVASIAAGAVFLGAVLSIVGVVDGALAIAAQAEMDKIE